MSGAGCAAGWDCSGASSDSLNCVRLAWVGCSESVSFQTGGAWGWSGVAAQSVWLTQHAARMDPADPFGGVVLGVAPMSRMSGLEDPFADVLEPLTGGTDAGVKRSLPGATSVN